MGEHFLTIGHKMQVASSFRGIYLKGHPEPRIAMVGRSNVGKSSLINLLLGHKQAEASKRPGKTMAIHCYDWASAKKILVDLPGYGYAAVSDQERRRWENLVEAYFDEDIGLKQVLFVCDARHGLTVKDYLAYQFLSSRAIAISIVFSKTDLIRTQAERHLLQKRVAPMLQEWGIPLAATYWISRVQKTGIQDLMRALKAIE